MTEQNVQNWIKDQITSNDVVLFMKGTKDFPQCGFSGRVTQILNYLGVEFKDVNVLADQELREGIKSFTNWPTIPQLYVKGRVCRRGRYHQRDVSDRRFADVLQGKRRRLQHDTCSSLTPVCKNTRAQNSYDSEWRARVSYSSPDRWGSRLPCPWAYTARC